ncbi:hypothetical protein [Roseomonas sp. USHLN139]|jgi:ElaB/YqjD/DUF883 family membrane-anchored ribosome-binding protein|uniref:hypothetical protein n=1 Tax=Roseomonas sp. USHLN139 TaxID=3081298 RepID=UPI003B020F53
MRRFSVPFDTGSVEDRIADLRQRLDALVEEQINPALSRAGSRAQDLASQLGSSTRSEAQQVATMVRDRPVATIAVAVGIGFLLAKLLKR